MYGKETDGAKFRDYFDWKEPICKAPSHRVLAIRRGEKEGILFHRILPEAESALGLLEKQFLTGRGSAAREVKQAIEDSYKRLLSHSMDGETRLRARKRRTLRQSVFSDNVRELLLASPLGQKRTMAVDPGFRTGCKTVILDAQGQLVFNHVLYCTGGAGQAERQSRSPGTDRTTPDRSDRHRQRYCQPGDGELFRALGLRKHCARRRQ